MGMYQYIKLSVMQLLYMNSFKKKLFKFKFEICMCKDVMCELITIPILIVIIMNVVMTKLNIKV